MLTYPVITNGNKDYSLVIVRRDTNGEKILFKKNFYVTEDNLKEVIINLENFLEDVDMKIDMYEQGYELENSETVMNLIPNSDNIIIKYRVDDQNSFIMIRDNNDYKTFEVNSNSLYSKLEKFYLYLYFSDSIYLDQMKLPDNLLKEFKEWK